MRVLITSTTYHPALNGQSVFAVNLAEGLNRAGHKVAVMFPEPRTATRERNGVQLEAQGALNLSFVHGESYVPVTFGGVRRVLEAFRPDIVHVQDHYPLSVVTVRIARELGVKAVGTNHFMPANLAPYVPGAALIRPAFERALWAWMLRLYQQLDLVTAPSQAAVNLLRAQGLRAPALPVSCGTDPRRFRPDPSVDRAACRRRYGLDTERPLFVSVGRVDREKRLDILIHAMAQVEDPNLRLGIIGEGAAAAELQALVRNLKLENRIRFLGRVPNEDLPVLLNSADAFVMASEAELLSIASLEAMASGLPMLLADAMALPELVTPGENGYLFKPGDPRETARAMDRLLAERNRWSQMGAASLERSKAHSLEVTVERYASLYVQVLEEAPALQRATAKLPRNRGAEIAHRSGHP
jgi:glycosyltransferase involved in cell wall biosynthesis